MAPKPPRISYQGLKLLKAFLDARQSDHNATLAGADITRSAKIASGTMYPLLFRFEEAKILKSAWETQRPEDLGRPRRRLYRLTAHGVDFATKTLKELSA